MGVSEGMKMTGRWDPSQRDEWERRYRQVVEVPVGVTVERPVQVPVGPVPPEAFAPASKNYGSN